MHGSLFAPWFFSRIRSLKFYTSFECVRLWMKQLRRPVRWNKSKFTEHEDFDYSDLSRRIRYHLVLDPVPESYFSFVALVVQEINAK